MGSSTKFTSNDLAGKCEMGEVHKEDETKVESKRERSRTDSTENTIKKSRHCVLTCSTSVRSTSARRIKS